MATETVTYVTPIMLILIGASGSTVFVADYIRTANFYDLYARMVITLNIGIAGVLWIALFSRLFGISNLPTFWISVTMFLLVDLCLWYQWYLLRRIRRENRD
jgi:hypothetical protein